MRTGVACLLIGVVLTGCATGVPPDALTLSPESLALRQLQSRRFDTGKELELLKASAGLLQDLGFTIEESETKLGVIVGSKDRDAMNAGQIVGAAFAAAIGVRIPIEKNQKIRVAVVTRPLAGVEPGTIVRVTFQRIVFSTENTITREESLEAPELYQEFFRRLSKAVFLDAHEI